MTTNNIFMEIISRFKNNTTTNDLTAGFRHQIKHQSFRAAKMSPQKLIQKYLLLQKKYTKGQIPLAESKWNENQRKLFMWFLLAYCKINIKKINDITDKEWKSFSQIFGEKDILFMKFESFSIQRFNERVQWFAKDDDLLNKLMKSQLKGKWAEISKALFNQSGGQCFKTSKQCRQHWLNHLDPTIKRGKWSVQQDLIILKSVIQNGRHWSYIVQSLSKTRTEHMAKNRYASLICFAKNKIKKQIYNDDKTLIRFLINQLQNQRGILTYENDQQIQLQSSIVDLQSEEQVQSQSKDKINLNLDKLQKTVVQFIQKSKDEQIRVQDKIDQKKKLDLGMSQKNIFCGQQNSFDNKALEQKQSQFIQNENFGEMGTISRQLRLPVASFPLHNYCAYNQSFFIYPQWNCQSLCPTLMIPNDLLAAKLNLVNNNFNFFVPSVSATSFMGFPVPTFSCYNNQ